MVDVPLLGQVVMRTVENARVRHDDLDQWFTELGLDKSFLPARPRPVDAFRKAASSATVNRFPYAAPWFREGAMASVRWIDDLSDRDRIVRRAERTIKINRINSEPETIGRVTFYKRAQRTRAGTEKLRFYMARDRLHVDEQKLIDQWFTDVRTRYEMGLGWVDTNGLRAIIRNYLTALHALRVRDGCYFLFLDQAAQTERLARLVGHFGSDCLFNVIDLMDVDKHRSWLAEAVSDETESYATTLIRQLNAVNRRFPTMIPCKQMTPVLAQYDVLLDQVHRYTILLGDGRITPFARAGSSSAVERLTDLIVAMRRRIIESQSALTDVEETFPSPRRIGALISEP